MKRSISTLAMCAACAAGLAAATMADAAEWTLGYAHNAPANDRSDDHVAGLFLKDYVESHSQGRIEVQIFPASELGNFREELEQVQANTLALANTTVGGITNFFPEIQVLDIPYMISDDRVAEALMETSFFDDVRDEVLERTGNIRLVAIADTGRWRSFWTTDKKVETAEDLKGVKMRTINSPMQIEFVKALGGTPTPLAWGELYSALQTGVTEGTKNASFDIMANSFDGALRNVILDQHTKLYGFYWISDAWLKDLPPDLQQVVIDGITQAAALGTQLTKRFDQEALAEFEEAGGSVVVPTDEQLATFLPARDTMIEYAEENLGEEWLDKFRAAIADAEAAVADDRAKVLGTASN